ncbi:hypothetical protein LCGC14_1323770 [marine sediment metagenome]|uniref:Uncharacterized protein n=1 Tax=marine sediment metagenome TaxID=412755 RepID=A0A0F9KIQ4_9ZZZZ
MAGNRIGIPGRFVDLYVRFVDFAGRPINADSTPQVEISDSAGTVIRALSNIGVGLVIDNEDGLYLLSYDIPDNTIDGYANDRWIADIGEAQVENTFEFLINGSGSISESDKPDFSPGDSIPWDFTKEESYGINVLLKMIKYRLKSDGTRKVRSGSEYVDVPCSIFTDAEFISFLVNSLSSFNQFPHFTQFLFSDPQIYGLFADVILQGAVLLALAAQALIERGREFSITDNGVTYQPPAVSEMLNTQYSTQLADYKEKLKAIKSSLKPEPKSLGTFRVTSISPAYMRLRHLRARQII